MDSKIPQPAYRQTYGSSVSFVSAYAASMIPRIPSTPNSTTSSRQEHMQPEGRGLAVMPSAASNIRNPAASAVPNPPDGNTGSPCKLGHAVNHEEFSSEETRIRPTTTTDFPRSSASRITGCHSLRRSLARIHEAICDDSESIGLISSSGGEDSASELFSKLANHQTEVTKGLLSLQQAIVRNMANDPAGMFPEVCSQS